MKASELITHNEARVICEALEMLALHEQRFIDYDNDNMNYCEATREKQEQKINTCHGIRNKMHDYLGEK